MRHVIFRSLFVCAAMRFTDEVLIAILMKMRRPGGCKLTPQEWKTLAGTEVTDKKEADGTLADLKGTEMWFQASYSWSVVAMAQVIRSVHSARLAKVPLYIWQAEDHLTNRPFNVSLRDASLYVLHHANMNDTGRLPGLGMVHVGMAVRITTTQEASIVPVDFTGVVVDVVLNENDRHSASEHFRSASEHTSSLIRLQNLPEAIIVKLDKCDTDLLPLSACALHEATGASSACAACYPLRGHYAVKPRMSEAFTVDITVPKEVGGVKTWVTVNLKAKRRQLAMTILNASTLHTLQGATCEPGLIFHWCFPRRLSMEMRWLAVYVALSRVPSLKQLRSIGLTAKTATPIRQIIEQGPPTGIVNRFAQLFEAKIQETMSAAVAAMEELGW